jgi:chitin synthase
MDAPDNACVGSNRIQSYKPNLSREFSTMSQMSEIEEAPMASDAQAFITQPVKRGKSLVRPERERIDPNHRQYHYRQAASQAPVDTVEPSKTGNLPRTLSRKGTTKSVTVRRGKSVLRREEKGGDEGDFACEQVERKKTWRDKLPGPWMTYCYLLTCCVPPQILRCAGKNKYFRII